MRRLSDLLPALVLIRLGQELGTASPATQAIHDVLELLATCAGILTRVPN